MRLTLREGCGGPTDIETEKNSVNLYLVVLKKSALDNIMTALAIIWKKIQLECLKKSLKLS